jgi:rRNA-processing protein FCF1
MEKIILDTNFLLIPTQFNVDIFSEIDRICTFKYKLYIVDKTIDELKKIIEEQKGKYKFAAKIALQLVKKKGIGIIKTKKGYVDDLILDLLDENHILATQDVLLKKRAVKKGIRTISMRSRKYLILK